MSRAEKDKGAAAERELAGLLREHLGIDIRRKLGAARDGGHDLSGLPVALEVKRCETLRLPAWWAQAWEQGVKANLPPALAYRRSRQPWRFRVPLAPLMGLPWTTWPAIEMTADVEIKAFAALVRYWMPEPVERAA